MIQAWLRIYISSSYSHYAVNNHFLCPAHKQANLCSCAQLDSGSGKWEAALLWQKNRMHHFHLYGMVQGCVAETDLSTCNESAATWSVIIHRQCILWALCRCYGGKKETVSTLNKRRQYLPNWYSRLYAPTSTARESTEACLWSKNEQIWSHNKD